MAIYLFKSEGWKKDVLHCILCLEKTEFTLQEILRYVPELERLHPCNFHVEEKIRQQLQILRDEGKIQFLEPGRYRINK